MCLSIPVKVLSLENEKQSAQINYNGIKMEVSTTLVPEINIGDYALLHAGFLIRKIDENEALETISLLNEIADLGSK
ncbi:MAG: HypC/HybG/HupF family hydrogenase formation chaperone [Pseudomonadota bacterium]